MQTIVMPPRNLFHLRIKFTGEDRYYGSLKALVDDAEGFDLSIHSLYKHEWEKPYENEQIIIKKGILITTKQKS